MFTILGGTGYIGGAVAAALRAAGEDVFVPDRGAAEIFARPLGHVIYAIGLTADFRSRPFDTAEAHVSYLAGILRRAEFESLLYLSSTRIFSGAVDGGFVVDPSDPSDLYNISKLMGEALCHASGKPGVRIVRLSNVIGGADPGSSNFVFALAEEALRGRILLRSHPETRKDYVALDDVVAILPGISRAGKGKVYSVGSGRQTSHAEWIAGLRELTNCSVEYTEGAPLFRFPPIDISPLEEEFGFSPANPIDLLPGIVKAHAQSDCETTHEPH